MNILSKFLSSSRIRRHIKISAAALSASFCPGQLFGVRPTRTPAVLGCMCREWVRHWQANTPDYFCHIWKVREREISGVRRGGWGGDGTARIKGRSHSATSEIGNKRLFHEPWALRQIKVCVWNRVTDWCSLCCQGRVQTVVWKESSRLNGWEKGICWNKWKKKKGWGVRNRPCRRFGQDEMMESRTEEASTYGHTIEAQTAFVLFMKAIISYDSVSLIV